MSNPASDVAGTGWRVSREPMPEHVSWVHAGRRLFASPEWATVLAALTSQSLYLWNPDCGIGAVVPVFRLGGLRIGFLGFPIAGGDFDAMSGQALSACARQVARAAGLDVVRVAHSQCATGDVRATSVRPEVWIDDLQAWSLGAHKRLTKDLAYARRSATRVALVEEGFDVEACFALYRATVSMRGGRLRYNPEYFRALHGLVP